MKKQQKIGLVFWIVGIVLLIWSVFTSTQYSSQILAYGMFIFGFSIGWIVYDIYIK